MPEVINTNIMSLTAQNNLNKSQSSLATAMQRLSSGLRINSSADDAAGFAISTRMTTQIDGLNTAAQNANDGISLAQTASGALSQITSNLQTIRQLAVQAANATNSSSDRAALDSEVQQRLAEITRVSQQTTFNGRRILDGSFGNAAFQVGANVGETISINLTQGTQASQIGSVATASASIASAFSSTGTAATSGTATFTVSSSTGEVNFSLDGQTIDVTGATGLSDLATKMQSALNTAFGAGKYTATNSASGFTITAATAGADPMTATATSGITAGGITSTAGVAAVAAGTAQTVTITGSDFSINGTSITGTFGSVSGLAAAVNAAGINGVSSYVNGSGSSAQLVVQSNGTASDGTSADGDSIKFAGAESTALGFNATAYTDSGSLASASSSSSINVLTVTSANDTINRIDSALASVSNIDSQLGAMQNRFDSAVSTAQAVSQNLAASRSRIEDADFASETASMSQAQILQQAGVSMLAQANSAPQLVLKLLQ